MNFFHENRVDLKKLLNPEKAIFPFCLRKNKKEISPHSVELHLTSFCNYNCYHCSYQKRRSKQVVIDDSHISLLVDDIINMGVQGVYWSGGGEPTTIKNFSWYIEKIADSEIEQALITNGIILNDQLISQLCRFNYIAISFQASESETYKKITGYDLKDKLYANISKLRGNLKKTVLGARCVINRYNYMEIAAIYDDAKDLGFDYIVFIPAIDYESRGNIELDEQEKAAFGKRVLEMVPRLDDSFTNLMSIASRDVSYYKKADNGAYPCYANNMRATSFVNYDGGVWLCQPHIGNFQYAIGNIYENRLSQIWNSERHNKVIDLLDIEHKIGNCSNCRSIAYNSSIHKFIRSGEGENYYDPFL
jgi:radical SAM protein with 4Fe4S-binding SPASM domain